MRPLWVEFPQDEATFAEESQFMLGPALLIAPVTSAGATSISVYLPPASVWYDAHTHTSAASGHRSVPVTLEQIPVYYRGGSVVVRKDRARRSSALMRLDPFTLVISLDAQLRANGTVFLDDGESFAYQQGKAAFRLLSVEGAGKTIRCQAAALSKEGAITTTTTSSYQSKEMVERVVILGLTSSPSTATVEVGGEKRAIEGGRAKDGSWVLRKPLLALTEDWVITLS